MRRFMRAVTGVRRGPGPRILPESLVADPVALGSLIVGTSALTWQIYADRKKPPGVKVIPRRFLSHTTLRLTGLAVLIAGAKRASLRDEWRSHLYGNDGEPLSDLGKTWYALGFLRASLLYRIQDAADLAWRPLDAVLASRELSTLFVLAATFGVALVFIHVGGLYGLAANLVNVAVVWGAAFGLIRIGRWWRGVKPPKHKARRAKE